jgi:hypothetical protein
MLQAIDLHFSASSSYSSWDVALMYSGAVNVEWLTTVVPLEVWQDAFRSVEHRDVVKAVLIP